MGKMGNQWAVTGAGGWSLNAEEHIAKLDWCLVVGDDGDDGSGDLGLDFIHHLHCLDDAKRLADGDRAAHLDEASRIGCGPLVEGAHHRRGDFLAIGHGGSGGRCGSSRKSGRCGCRQGRCGDGCRKAGKQSAQLIDIAAFLELELEVLLGEIELGKTMLVHELDDAADFLEVHDEKELMMGEREWPDATSLLPPSYRAGRNRVKR